MMDNNNFYGQDNNINNDPNNFDKPSGQDSFQSQDQQPTGFAPMTGQPIYGQAQQQSYQAQPQYQPQYQQQPVIQQVFTPNATDEVVTIGDWMITFLVMMIPCVNVVMLFVWAFGNGKKSKSNYFKAALIWALIWFGIGVVITIIGAILGVSILSSLS